jgi:hypothetical protein
MGLQDVIRWLLPREDVFYTLIERQRELLEEAARGSGGVRERGAGRADPRDRAGLEHKADAIVYEIEEQLARVFVTPIDREDIQLLARRSTTSST